MPGKSLIFCDVRDVAKAHILAALNPDAHGRCETCILQVDTGHASMCD